MTTIVVNIIDKVSEKNEMTVLKKEVKQTPKTLFDNKVQSIDGVKLQKYTDLKGSKYSLYALNVDFELPYSGSDDSDFDMHLFTEANSKITSDAYAFDGDYSMYRFSKEWDTVNEPMFFGRKEYEKEQKAQIDEYEADRKRLLKEFEDWKVENEKNKEKERKQIRKDYLKKIKDLKALGWTVVETIKL